MTNLAYLLSRRQGASGEVVAPPLEIVDPPELFSAELLERFPSMKAKEKEFATWWEKEKNRQLAITETLAKLIQKVNSTT